MTMSFDQSISGSSRSESNARAAFTITELLVIIAVLAILAGMSVASARNGRERSRQVECGGNLRQVGVGLSVYVVEANGYVPICGWPQNQQPWQTYSAARVVPGTSTLTRGFMSLGLLFRTRAVPDARMFYCPELATLSNLRTYDYYVSVSNQWPSTPPGSNDEQIRTGYNYYPQLRATQAVGTDTLPSLIYAPVTLEFGGTLNLVAPAHLTQLNPAKSITTDLLQSWNDLSHRSAGAVAGVNALFPDGRVVFQRAREHPAAFDPAWWQDDISPGNDTGTRFRFLMNQWEP